MTLFRFWRGFRVRLVLLAALIAGASVGCGVLAVQGGTAVVAAAVLALVVLWTVVRLVRSAERPARDLTRFLEGIRYDDASEMSTAKGTDPLTRALADAFESVGDAFRHVRAEREEQAGYLEAVVRHVGVALVAFRTDGT